MSFEKAFMEDSESDTSQSTVEDFIKHDLLLLDVNIKQNIPKIVIQPRTPIVESDWWDVVYPSLPERAYKQIYRIKKSTMDTLIHSLWPHSYYKSFNEFQKAVCITMNYSATHARQFDLQFNYNCATKYVNKHIKHVVELITTYLLPDVVRWPDINERRDIASQIYRDYKIPYCIGTMDGSYIKCLGYGETPMDYTCRKMDFAFNVVLICDNTLLIRDYNTNNVGALGDRDVFESLLFYQNLRKNFQMHEDDINNNLGLSTYFMLSDKGLQLSNYVIVPYDLKGKKVLSTQQKRFNHYICNFRQMSEACNATTV